jgi:hypothetical protein
VNFRNLRHGQTCVDHLLDAPRALRVAQVALLVVGDDLVRRTVAACKVGLTTVPVYILAATARDRGFIRGQQLDTPEEPILAAGPAR